VTNVFLLSLAMAAAGIWLLASLGARIAGGRVRPVFGARDAHYDLRSTPFRFVLHAALWSIVACGLTLAGMTLLGKLDPWLLVLPPCMGIALRGASGTMELASRRSGDEGRGSLDALQERDRAGLAKRVDALPDGSERRIFQRVLDAWPDEAPPDAYRGAEGGERHARFDALRDAGDAERRRMRRRLVASAVGVLPLPVLGYARDALFIPALGWLGSAISVAIAACGVAFIVTAVRSVDALVGRASTMDVRA
jgi:hypothetical protein